MRERVTIQQPTQSTTSGGQPTVTWSDYATRWASVESLTSREALQNIKQESRIDWKVTMRYDANITTQMRISWNSKTLEFEPPLADTHFRFMTVLCREVK